MSGMSRPLAQQVGQRADVVLVSVSEHDRVDVGEAVAEVRPVRQGEVHAGRVGLAEQHAAVDDEQPAAVRIQPMLEHRHVAADLGDAAQRDNPQDGVGQGRRPCCVGLRRRLCHVMEPNWRADSSGKIKAGWRVASGDPVAGHSRPTDRVAAASAGTPIARVGQLVADADCPGSVAGRSPGAVCAFWAGRLVGRSSAMEDGSEWSSAAAAPPIGSASAQEVDRHRQERQHDDANEDRVDERLHRIRGRSSMCPSQ